MPRGVSTRIIAGGTASVKLLLIQHWVETENIVRGCNKSDADIGIGCFGDQVWLMELLRNSDNTTERIALVLMQTEEWEAANPQPATIYLV